MLDQDVQDKFTGYDTTLAQIVTNVKNYKCSDGQYVKGDGVHDDTTGIQTAINSVPVGGVVYFPAGVYIISQPLTLLAQVVYRGTGWNSVIQAKANCVITTSMLVLPTSSTDFHYNVFIEDLLIDGNKANNASGTYNGVSIGSAYNGKMKNVRVINMPGTNNSGIRLDGTANNNCSQFHLEGCWVYGSVGDGVFMSSYSQDCHIIGGDYGGNGNYGFNMNASSSSIRGAVIWGNKWGIYLDGQSNQITNNNIEGNAAYGIYVTQYGNFATIEGNKIYDNSTGPAGNYDGIYVNGVNGSNVQGVVIVNNSIYAGIVGSTGYYRYAINLDTYHKSCNISNNEVRFAQANGATTNNKNAINGLTDQDIFNGVLLTTTSNRPTLLTTGHKAYDLTLKKPIWWNGTNWTDATGATV